MAESMSPSHIPDKRHARAYEDWADGGWGLILTGNVQIGDTYLGTPEDVAILKRPSAAAKEIKDCWNVWASTCQRNGTPAIVQINHPGRQSPFWCGRRSFFAKTIAPSPVELNLGSSVVERYAVSFVFGTPRELTIEEISGEGGIIDQYVEAAKVSFDAGFKGVQLHGAHGYLLTQFLSPRTNLRTDEFGGSSAKRAEIVLRIIHGIRKVTNREFCIGIKMNSVDASTSDSVSDVLEQIKLIVEAGIDFIEISGGTYENALMTRVTDALPDPDSAATKKTAARESFFLEFAKTVRDTFPNLILMVTGGFRSRVGMEEAITSGACDLIGIGRPSAVLPKLPKEIILNTEEVSDEEAHVALTPVQIPFLVWMIPIKQVGAGFQTEYYGQQIRRMGNGLRPRDTRLRASEMGRL